MASEEQDLASSERVRELEDMVQKLKQENMKLLGTVKDGPRKIARQQLDSPEDPEADLIPLDNMEDDPDVWLYESPLHPLTPAQKAITPRQWLLEGFHQTKDEDIPSLDEVRKAISFQTTEVEASPTAARLARAKVPMDGLKATSSAGGMPQGTRPPRAKPPPDEEAIPVVRARIPPDDVMPLTEEVAIGEDSTCMATEEDVPAMPVRAKLPFDEDVVKPIRAKLPPDDESTLVVRVKVPPEDFEEQVSNSLTEEDTLIIRAKLPPQDGIEDMQQTSRSARTKLLGAGGRPLRAKLPSYEEHIPVIRAEIFSEDLVSNSSIEEAIPIARAKRLPGEDGIEDQQVSKPFKAKLPGAGARPLRAKLPPDEESVPVIRAKLPPEDLEEQVSNSLTEEATPIIRAKLPPAERDVTEDVQQVSRPARAKLPGAGDKRLRAKLPPDEESILPVVTASEPLENVEEQVSVSPTEDSVTPVKAKLSEGRGMQQVLRPTRAKAPLDDENSPSPRKVVKSAPSTSQEARPRPGSAHSQSSMATPLSGLPKPPRNISSPNLPQTGGSPTPKGPKQSVTQSIKRVSSLTSHQSSPSPPPLQPSLSPSPTDGGLISADVEQVGSKVKVAAASRLPLSPSSNRNPSARGLATPSQKLLVAKGDRAVPSSSSGPSSTPQSVASRRVLPSAEGGGGADSPSSSLKVPSKPSPRLKAVASPSNQQKRLVSAPTSRVSQAAQPAANEADDWSEGCY